CSAFADRWRASVTLFGLFFINFEFVCCPDCARRRFIPGNKSVISGLNFSEVQASHFMVVFIRETFALLQTNPIRICVGRRAMGKTSSRKSQPQSGPKGPLVALSNQRKLLTRPW